MSNIVDSYVVLNQVPIVRVIDVPPSFKYGEECRVGFERIHYIDIYSRELSTISIKIANESGDLIDFNGGEVVLVIHIKRN